MWTGGRGCDVTAGGWPVDPPDALVQILEDQEERDGRRAYTLAIVDGVLHVTPRMDPGVCPVKVERERIGYTLAWDDDTAVYATPEEVARAVDWFLLDLV